MAAEHPNATLVRRGFDAFAEGDTDALVELFAEDVAWHQPPGQNPTAGDVRGRDAALAVPAEVGELTEGSLRIEVRDVVANDAHVVALLRGTAAPGARAGTPTTSRCST